MSQREFAYREIRNAITFGQLKPGERLVEKKLSEIFKIGRTPLREALSQLQIEGYLDFLPNRGVTIGRMSVQSLREIYDLLALTEGYATRIATKNLSKVEIKKIIAVQNKLAKAYKSKNSKKWLEENVIFHEFLIKASRNNLLHKIVDNLRNRIYRYRSISLAVADSFEDVFRAHEEILKAICKRDGNRAGKAMERHVLQVGKKTAKLLEQLPGL